MQVEGAGLDDDTGNGQHQRDLVGDELPGRPEAAGERVLVGRGPARDQDAEYRDRRDPEGEEDADVEVGEQGVGPERHRDVDEHDRRHHDVGRDAEEGLVGPDRGDVLLLHELADFRDQLQRTVGAGFHRPEPALHVAHHLEQEDLHVAAGRNQYGQNDTDGAEHRLLPVGPGAEDVHRQHQRSMSPRMKYREARMVMTSGTNTPCSSHGTIETLLNEAERILQRNGPRPPLLTT